MDKWQGRWLMVNLIWKTPIVLALLLFFLPLTAFSQAKVPLIGTWHTPGPEGPILLVFESKNRLIFDGEPAKYSLSPWVIRIEDEEGVVDYPYELSGDILTLTLSKGMQIQFARAKPGSPSPPSAGKTAPPPPADGSVGSSELAAEIAGIWWGYSGTTERKIGLCPQGRYRDYTESSFGGSSRGSLGNTSMNWGTAGRGGGTGTWTIRGNFQEGVISVRYANGKESSVQYQQFGERGCLLFNGNKLCRTGSCD
jgi:hypothetical protein